MPDHDKAKRKSPIALSLKQDLEQYLRDQAARNYRTVTAEISMRLERTRQQDAELREQTS